MTIEVLKNRIHDRPFQPFRLTMSSGKTYDVRHPENAIVLRGGLAVSYGSRNGDLPVGVATLSLLHITAIDDIPVRTIGHRRKRRT